MAVFFEVERDGTYLSVVKVDQVTFEVFMGDEQAQGLALDLSYVEAMSLYKYLKYAMDQ
jgi:hypothetical protein